MASVVYLAKLAWFTSLLLVVVGLWALTSQNAYSVLVWYSASPAEPLAPKAPELEAALQPRRQLSFSGKQCTSSPLAEEQAPLKSLTEAGASLPPSQFQYTRVANSYARRLPGGYLEDVLVMKSLCLVGKRNNSKEFGSFVYYITDDEGSSSTLFQKKFRTGAVTRYLHGFNFNGRPSSWLKTRKSVRLVRGRSFLASITDLEMNPFHFSCRVAPLALVNSALSPSKLLTAAANGMDIDNLFVLMKDEPAFHRFFQREGTLYSEIFRLLLEAATSATAKRSREKKRVARVDPGSLCWQPGFEFWAASHAGKAEEEMVVTHGLLQSASEEDPVCFEEVVLPCACCQPGLFRGGMEVTIEVQSRLLQQLGLPATGRVPIANGLKAAFLSRGTDNATARTISALEEQRLMSLVQEHFTGGSTIAFMGNLTFRTQIEILRIHHFFVGIHGAHLTVPSFIAPPGSILFELKPYFMGARVVYRDHGINSGLVYMSYELSASTPVDGDDAIKAVANRLMCLSNDACREHVKKRKIVMEEEDRLAIRRLVAVAAEILSLDLNVHEPHDGERLRKHLWEKVGCTPQEDIRDSCRHGTVDYMLTGVRITCTVLQFCL